MYGNPCLKFWQCLIISATSEPLWVIWNRRRYWLFRYVVTSTQLNSAYRVIFSSTAACNGERLARDCRFCAPAHHFLHPTSSLPQFSPGSPVIRRMVFRLQRAKILGSVQLVSRFPTYVVLISNVTDRQTDDMQSQYRALLYSASCAN